MLCASFFSICKNYHQLQTHALSFLLPLSQIKGRRESCPRHQRWWRNTLQPLWTSALTHGCSMLVLGTSALPPVPPHRRAALFHFLFAMHDRMWRMAGAVVCCNSCEAKTSYFVRHFSNARTTCILGRREYLTLDFYCSRESSRWEARRHFKFSYHILYSVW
jgi:hypothetical protein